jgi:predicted RNA-binding protein associated with RNAse of E/G family
MTPGASDCNLRFYTGGFERLFVNPTGNVGLGSTLAPTRLYVEGDATVSGTLTASNLNVLYKQFYNNDNLVFQSRLQVAPYQSRFINEFNNTSNYSFQIEGLWKIEPQKVQVFLNGVKLVYLSSNQKDYDTSYTHIGSSTQINVLFDTVLNGQDIVDLTVWPSYLTSNALLEPGFVLQTIQYSIWNSNVATQHVSYMDGNVGIGTSLPMNALSVYGNIFTSGTLYASNLNILGETTILNTVTSNTERIVIQNDGTGPALQVFQSGIQPIAEFYDDNVLSLVIANGGNVGIGTSIANYTLDVKGKIHADQLNITRASDQSTEEFKLQSISNALRLGGSDTGIIIDENSVSILGLSNVLYVSKNGGIGIGTTQPKERLHVQDNVYISGSTTISGTLTASNLAILGDTVVLNTITSNTEQLVIQNAGTGPALMVTQNGAQPVARFVDAESGVALLIADTGKIGIGTDAPSVSLDIRSTDALRVPVGNEGQKPIGQLGYVRYNTTTQQYEGYGAGNTWGSLGGVKSVDGLTYITAEMTPGASDCNLRFYTGGVQRLFVNPTGNVGLGSTLAPTRLYVEGDATVSGTLTASNLNVLYKQFYNNDSTVFQNRLQIAPINIQFINTTSGINSNQFIMDGLWKVEPNKTQIFLNGAKLIYLSSNQKDFDVTYVHQTSNTFVTVTFDTPLENQDIVDMTIWPSYIDTNALLQPGFTLQNIIYTTSNIGVSTSWTSNSGSGEIYYIGGNVGIGTTLTKSKLDIFGTIRGQNKDTDGSILELYNHQWSNVIYVSSNATIGLGTLSPTARLDIMGDVQATTYKWMGGVASISLVDASNLATRMDFNSNAIYSWSFGSNEKLRLQTDGNVGIGTTIAQAKLHIEGNIYASGTLTASNLTILGDTIILNSITSNTEQLIIRNDGTGPALHVTQSGLEPIAQFVDAEYGTAMIITDGGYVGIGTTQPEVALVIESTGAIRLPVGTNNTRPNVPRKGQIRYNSTYEQFEGYGAGNQWGSLGGVKSVDGLTYITAEETPGAGDCNLRFYTNGSQQVILNPDGNLGIGTTLSTHKLRVEGDIYVGGLLTVSNVNVLGNSFSNAYNNDSIAFRSRLQINPTRYIETVNASYKNSFQLTIQGLYAVYPENVEVYINGTKYAYVSSSLHDYTISTSLTTTSTLLTVVLDDNIYGGDVIEIVAWPSYINDSMGLQPGFVVQNINLFHTGTQSVLSQPMIQPLQPAPHRFTYDITSNQSVFTETIQGLFEFSGSRTEVYNGGIRLVYTPTFQDFSVSYTQFSTTTTVTLTLAYPATSGDIIEIYYYATPISTSFGSNFGGVIYQDFTYFQKVNGSSCNIVYAYGNLGIGTTYAKNPLHVEGNITFNGLMYDHTGKAIWIPGSMVEWKPCTYPNPSLTAPGTGLFNISFRKGQFKYMGNEVVYQFRVEGSITNKPLIQTANYILSLEYAIDTSYYSSETILGDAWLTITSGGTKTTYKAYIQTLTSSSTSASIRYVNGTFDNSLSELNVGTSIVLQGTLVYKTSYLSTEQSIPTTYLPNSFVQNTLGYTGLNNGGVPSRARLDVIESGGVNSCNLPVMILDQRGNNDSIFEIRSNASEIKLIVNRYGNVGIGTSLPTEKVSVDGTVRASAFIGDGSQLTGLGGYSIWSILNASNIAYSNQVILGNQQQVLSNVPVSLIVADNEKPTIRLWSTSTCNAISPSMEWIRGSQNTPESTGNYYWDAYVAPDGTYRVRNRNLGVLTDTITYGISNVKIHGEMNIQSNVWVSSTLYASNIQVLGDFVTLNTITSNTEQMVIVNDGTGPALRVVQKGVQPIAQFIDTESGPSLIISNDGKIGFGTYTPQVAVDIYATDALHLPSGTQGQRPAPLTKGYIRYNTELDQFEGFGAGNTWGSLGGVKSVDGLSYITAEMSPGISDCNLRFYTGGIQRLTVGSNGNIGIGTNIASQTLHVQGDAIVTGILTTSNINIVGKDFFYNNDSTVFRSRIQLSPYNVKFTIPYNNYTTHGIRVDGLWKFESEKSEVYLNGLKLAYMDSNVKDYSITSSNIGLNTDIIVAFESGTIMAGDVLDMVLWPSYINDLVTMQPGFMLQNVAYSHWTSNTVTGDIQYVVGNVGIGTTLPSKTLHVQGDIVTTGTLYASNLNILGDTTVLNTVTSNTERIVVQNDGTGPALQVFQSGVYPIAEFYDDNVLSLVIANGGNVGIGTSIANYTLDVSGSVRVNQLNITDEFKLQNTSNILQLGGNQTSVILDATSVSIVGSSNVLYVHKDGMVGIGTTQPKERLHVQDNVYISGTLTASNLAILGDTVVLNTITSNTEQLIVTNTGTGPALFVTQTGTEPIARFVDAESGVALLIADTGKLGIGTDAPSVFLDVRSTDALRLPVGSEAQKPTGQLGYIRYNTTTQQYEGYGAGNTWGSLGGVKSVDGLTYITAELTPGASDCNLRFYTGGVQKAYLSSNLLDSAVTIKAPSFVGDGSQLTGIMASGVVSQWQTIGSTLYLPGVSNIGIGTTIPKSQLHVEGNALVTGILTTSNLNLLGNNFSFNNDITFRNRLQVAPYYTRIFAPSNNYTTHTVTVDGLWKFESVNTEVYINGARMAYLSSNSKDYDVTYSLGASNTDITITFEDNSIMSNDVLDITLWPSYLSNDVTLQPGYTIQNITYVNSNVLPFSINDGYVGLNATTLPRARFDIREDANTSNLPVLVLDQAGPNDILQARSNAITKLVVTKQGYVGIGTTAVDKPLVVQGDINFNGNLYQNGVLFKSSSSTQTFDNNTQTIKYALGGFEVSATGNYYVGTRIMWANVTTSDLAKIHLSGKCSVAGSDLDNAYRRFETIVATRNDNATKPRGIVNTETANYYTSAFTSGITHEINRYSSNAVDLKIKWATNIAVNNYTVTLQLEIVGPTNLGAITCTDIYGTY